MLSQCFYSHTRHPFFLTGRRHDAADDTYWTTLTTEVIYVIVDAYFQVIWRANSHQKFFSEFIGKPLCGVEYLWHSTRKLRITDIIGSHRKQLTQRGYERGEFLTGNLLMLIMAEILIVVRDMASRIWAEKERSTLWQNKMHAILFTLSIEPSCLC